MSKNIDTVTGRSSFEAPILLCATLFSVLFCTLSLESSLDTKNQESGKIFTICTLLLIIYVGMICVAITDSPNQKQEKRNTEAQKLMLLLLSGQKKDTKDVSTEIDETIVESPKKEEMQH